MELSRKSHGHICLLQASSLDGLRSVSEGLGRVAGDQLVAAVGGCHAHHEGVDFSNCVRSVKLQSRLLSIVEVDTDRGLRLGRVNPRTSGFRKVHGVLDRSCLSRRSVVNRRSSVSGRRCLRLGVVRRSGSLLLILRRWLLVLRRLLLVSRLLPLVRVGCGVRFTVSIHLLASLHLLHPSHASHSCSARSLRHKRAEAAAEEEDGDPDHGVPEAVHGQVTALMVRVVITTIALVRLVVEVVVVV